MKYHITTFGCQQNIADSERIAAVYESRGYQRVQDWRDADVAVINTCMVREQAEDRVYGLARHMKFHKEKNPSFKIIITGCMVGAAAREPSQKLAKKLKKMLPYVDEFLPIEEVGFEYAPLREDKEHAWIPITHGCNNYCSFCIVPFSRGKEISRPYEDIIKEAQDVAQRGYKKITLLGQNVNSYGADILRKVLKEFDGKYKLPSGELVKPVVVKHLGRTRIPTLFPYLLKDISEIKGFEKVSFVSSNPWDFSDELIEVIATHPNIDRVLHLPVQAGDNEVLKRMNRWYSREEYMQLIKKIRDRVEGVEFTTDIIVGFPGETEEQFEQTVDLCKQVGFQKAYIACYSPRPGTLAARKFVDDVPYEEKKRRFHILDRLINHKNKK